MRASRVGAERSCMYLFAYVVGARIAVVGCACVCAGMRAGSRQTGADVASCGRAGCSLAGFDACAYHKYTFDFLRPTIFIQSRRSPSTAWKHNDLDHPRGTRRQKLKLHADNSTIFTSYCSHEQH